MRLRNDDHDSDDHYNDDHDGDVDEHPKSLDNGQACENKGEYNSTGRDVQRFFAVFVLKMSQKRKAIHEKTG
jgi:hypothetical protein